ncbi:MAG: M14 family metallopeptidase [Alphaproteobacteria bacterium]|nr:M14 family metallopeptidase [Alphaproteobacteria bacterium]
MSASRYFSDTYQAAREKFRAAVAKAGGIPSTEANPGKGPDGGSLATDAAWFGPKDPSRALLLVSGTHGVEGFCGSGAEVGWIETGGPGRLPPGIGALVIHAINPHGFAWLRRVTDDNVDLNRNFVDFTRPLPENPAYDEIAAALDPERWDDAARADCARRLQTYADKHGDFALQSAISRGQHKHKGGLFFGGTVPTWSRRTFLALCRRHLARCRHVGFIDLHTGLGPYGYGEPICMHAPGTSGFSRVSAWYGDQVTSPEQGNSTSAVVVGTLGEGLERELPQVAVTGMALEYGTQPVPDVLLALRADNWLHRHGDPASPLGRKIKRQIRDAFYQDKDDWKEMVLKRALEMFDRAVAGLARA